MLEIINLRKEFPAKDKTGKIFTKTAVDSLSLRIENGEVFALLGPNGAGKTTTIRMLTNLALPTSGRIIYDGIEMTDFNRDVKSIIGVVGQSANFDRDLTVAENMELHARLHHIEARERKNRIAELLDFAQLAGAANENVTHLSGGMKRRLMIARALLHRPKILFLDEPTAALDPHARRIVWDLVRRLEKDGITVFLTTHYIEEAQSLCGRVAIMNKGKLIALDTPRALCDALGRFAVEWDGESGREYRFFAERGEAKNFALTIDAQGSVVVRETNLEDVFIEITGGASM